jgi:hypothetical protein
MGGDQELRRGQQSMQDPNVIIPDVGAGRYWYVDPKAGLAQQPASQFAQQSAAQVYDPMADTRSNQAQLKAWDEQQGDTYQRIMKQHNDLIDALRRMGLTEQQLSDYLERQQPPQYQF